MRLVDVGRPISGIGGTIRAALTALGRGDDTTGGIALIGVTDEETGHPVDAALVLPSGVVLVLGVDLPGPALRLDAPLHGEWKADGWRLVGTGTAVNPGSRALAAAEAIAHRLRHTEGIPLPVHAVLAVGPYADSVAVPDADEVPGVRVLHPGPADVRDALRAFRAEGTRVPCSLLRARAAVRALAGEIDLPPEADLLAEGFAPDAGRAPESRPAAAVRTGGLATEAVADEPVLAGPRARRPWGLIGIAILALLLFVTALILAAANGSAGAEEPAPRHAGDGTDATTAGSGRGDPLGEGAPLRIASSAAETPRTP